MSSLQWVVLVIVAVASADRCTDYGGHCLDKSAPCDNWTKFNWWPCGLGGQCCLHTPDQDAECGVTDRPADSWRVTGGVEAEHGAWPWLVSLTMGGEHNCGASIIDDYWLLTAAHCLYDHEGTARTASDITAVVGDYGLSTYEKSERRHQIHSLYPHKSYTHNKKGVYDDIALIRLVEPIRYNRYVRKICMPRKRSDDFFHGKQCWVAGWGKTYALSEELPETVRQGSDKLLSNYECHASWEPHKVTDGHICQAGHKINACDGDSGGPLMCRDGNRWYQLGAVSFGNRMCWAKPSVFTRISHYLGWMQDIMANFPNQ